jgi:hypothetical protein
MCLARYDGACQVIPAIGRLMWEDFEFKACLKQNSQKYTKDVFTLLGKYVIYFFMNILKNPIIPNGQFRFI